MRPPLAYARPAWYDHDSCNDITNEVTVVRPRAANDPDAFQNLQRHQRDTMDWYRHEHEHDLRNLHRPKLRSEHAVHNFRRMVDGTRPEWISSNGDSPRNNSLNGAIPIAEISTRFNLPESKTYRDRNRNGGVSSWYSHENVEAPSQPLVRVVTQDGFNNASRARNTSENWFVYAPERNPPEEAPRPRLLSVTAMALRERGHGGQLQKVMQQPEENEEVYVEPKTLPRVHSEGYSIQQFHSKGNIHQVFNHSSPEPPAPPRRVPPESEAGRIKNQGGIADVFTGYPDPPAKHNGRRITAEGKRNEARQRDSMKEVFNFERTHTPDMCITGRVIRPHPPGLSSSSAGQQVSDIFARYGQPAPPPTARRIAYSRKHQTSNVGRLLMHPQAFR